MRTHSSFRGVTIVELMVVVAVLGVLLSIGFVQLRPPSVRLFANDVKALVEQARYEAIKRNAPVAVVYVTGEQRFESRLDAAGTAATLRDVCDDGTVLLARDGAQYRGAGVVEDGGFAGFELIWLPSGQRRTCDGAPASTTASVVLSDGRMDLAVEVSIGGRVSIQ